MKPSLENEKPADLLWRQAIILALGFSCGILLAIFISGQLWRFGTYNTAAKSLGIVSLPILNAYPKSLDLLSYLNALCSPVLLAGLFWLCWSRTLPKHDQDILTSPPFTEQLPDKKHRALCLFAVILFYLLVVKNVSLLKNATTGWTLLSEEGLNLAWAQNILDGKIYGKDFRCEYGPAVIYPVAWVMRLFGESILAVRAYTHALNCIAYGAVVYLLYRTLNTMRVFLFASFIYLLTFPPIAMAAPNRSHLRVIAAMVPLYLVYVCLKENKTRLLLFAGILLGIELQFSQEVAACSAVALFFQLGTFAFYQRNYALLLRQSCLLVAGTVTAVLPLAAYLYAKDVLWAFWSNIIEYPGLFALGLAAIPFPTFHDVTLSIFGDQIYFQQHYIFYSVIIIYAITATRLLPCILRGKPNVKTIYAASLLLFGMLLFRSALGRSDAGHLYFVAPPALLLVFMMIDAGFSAPRGGRSVGSFCRQMALPALLMLALWNLIPYGESGKLLANIPVVTDGHQHQPDTQELPGIPRALVRFDKETRKTLLDIQLLLATYAKPGDGVYFFPNEVLYHFLFDRKTPTRFMMSYQAATYKHREQLISDLEHSRPTYVVYSKHSWRVDNIGEEVQVPEIVDYLLKKYQCIEDLGEVWLLQRI